MPNVSLSWVAALALLAAAPAHAADDSSLVGYVRLGEAVVFAATPRPAPGFGFGLRAELTKVAIDASFLNLVSGPPPLDQDRGVTAGSLLRIEVLRYLRPQMSKSAYVGGGIGWGFVGLGRVDPPDGASSGWDGRGLQGELTAGYELSRHTPLRVFIQLDASAPLFYAHSETFTYSRASGLSTTGDESRYLPSIIFSLGMGWQRGR